MADKSDMLRQLRIDRTAMEDAAPRGLGAMAVGGVALAALVLGAGLGWVLKPAPPAPVVAAAPPVAAGAPGVQAQVGGLVASGFVVARRRATVAAEVTGRVLDVRVEEGQTVKRGQVLAVLDATLARADLASAQARIATANAAVVATSSDLAEARRNLERTAKLAENQFASDASLKTAQARVETLAAQEAQARAQAAASRRDAERTAAQVSRFEIRAPFDGVVVDKAAQPGEIISPMSSGGFTRTGICTIVDMQSLEIEVDVNEAFISQVREGQRVSAVLDAYPDVTFPGKVIATIPTASRDKATVRVRVGFDQLDPRLLPDMAIKVTFARAEG